MKTVTIELAMLVRMTKAVQVRVPDDFEPDEQGQRQFCTDIYEADSGVGFEIDESWGVEEGTHEYMGVMRDNPRPQFVLDEDGVIHEVPEKGSIPKVVIEGRCKHGRFKSGAGACPDCGS